PVTGLDPHLVVFHENKQDRAIVFSLLSRLPNLISPLREIIQRTGGREFGPDRDDDLVRCLALELRDLLVEAQRGFFRNDTGVVVEISHRLGWDDFGGGRYTGENGENK